MKLTDTTLRKTKPKESITKLTDGKGLYIEIHPNGSKLWRIAYRFLGKQKTLYLPSYPEMSLAEAREELHLAKTALAGGIDPKVARELRQAELVAVNEKYQRTFKKVAEDWLVGYKKHVTPKQISKIERMLDKYLYPAYGAKPVSEIKAIDILRPASKKEDEGKRHTAHRLISLAGQVLDHAIVLGYLEFNLARNGLTKKLLPERTTHYAAITDPNEIGELLCNIDDYSGSAIMKYYLKILPYVFTRPTELRMSRWEEFDLEKKMWVIPKGRMKIKEEDHYVPLSEQVIKLLQTLKKIGEGSEFLFPGARAGRTLSDAGPLNALRAMGYDNNTMTVHGFRSTASTCLNERGYPHDHIERQLAHKEQNEVRAAYNRADYLQQRRELLQDWANILDELKANAQARRVALREERLKRAQ